MSLIRKKSLFSSKGLVKISVKWKTLSFKMFQMSAQVSNQFLFLLLHFSVKAHTFLSSWQHASFLRVLSYRKAVVFARKLNGFELRHEDFVWLFLTMHRFGCCTISVLSKFSLWICSMNYLPMYYLQLYQMNTVLAQLTTALVQ